MRALPIILFLSIFSLKGISQNTGKFIPYENKFYQQIEQSLSQKDAKEQALVFKAEPPKNYPKSVDEFTAAWCQNPISQGKTGTCWCFSTTSFLESEIKRKKGVDIKLSEMYIVYHEYLEKAAEFVRTQGKTYLGEGSETNAVTRLIDKYGMMPFAAYNGKPTNAEFYDHSGFFDAFNAYLMHVKETHAWNEEVVLGTVKSLLNQYFGAPPSEFSYEGKTYTPLSFKNEFLGINGSDFVHFMSLKESPYYQKAVYNVPDNWWKSNNYYNIPLKDFIQILKDALKSGYTIAIGGDVSEPGYLPEYDLAFIPSFDILADAINEDARQMRFTNGSTTDDHAIHLVGYKEDKDGWWFLIKDSGSGARNGKNKGYYFYHEDYVKLKTMSFTISREAVQDYLTKHNL